MWNLTQSQIQSVQPQLPGVVCGDSTCGILLNQPQSVQPQLPRLKMVCGDSTCGISINPNPRLRSLDSLGCVWCVVTAHV